MSIYQQLNPLIIETNLWALVLELNNKNDISVCGHINNFNAPMPTC